MADELFSPLPLRSGATLGNRIAKAALEEDMAGDGRLPDRDCWACTGAGPPVAPDC
jgi:2,4-dienoyl-CoA reductase-like NADH-dependent reductase (Old Yellow Enzyme family)